MNPGGSTERYTHVLEYPLPIVESLVSSVERNSAMVHAQAVGCVTCMLNMRAKPWISVAIPGVHSLPRAA